MPISGGPPGLTMAFETETENVPASASLVLGGSKILSAWSSSGVLDLWRQHTPGNWSVVQTPAGDDVDILANMNFNTGAFTSFEAAYWRIENIVAAIQTVYLSVVNIG